MAKLDASGSALGSEPEVSAKPFGPVAAAFLASGIGALTLGILTTLAEASTPVHDALELSERVGTLSGKTVFALVAWLVAWAVLHPVLKDREPAPAKVFVWTGVLFAIATVLTFPTFFTAFAQE